jgi:hypothetical protein
MSSLFQSLAAKVDEWRQDKYPCDDYPAIREVFEFSVEDEITSKIRYLCRAQYLAHYVAVFAPSEKQILKNYREVPLDILEDSPTLAAWALKAALQ